MNPNLTFISGNFLDLDLPPEKRYLLRYFTTDIQRLFLWYYLTFGTFENFKDHTGVHRSIRWIYDQKARLEKVQAAHRKAKSDFDFDRLAAIENGRYQP